MAPTEAADSERTEPRVDLVKYVFLDVVDFTNGRTVEAQADIVANLNEIVAQETASIPCDESILLPTGDGVCVGIVGRSNFDAHMRLALSILVAIKEHNAQTKDEMRRFKVRIGISENSDNIVSDVNGRKNVAGAGINLASRIMDLADASQILISPTVHEVLSNREQYFKCFRTYSAKIKHGLTIKVYQYLADAQSGLNISPPSTFAPPRKSKRRLTEFEAYYIANALAQRQLLIPTCGVGVPGEHRGALVLLWFLATDSIGFAHQTDITPNEPTIYGRGSITVKESLEYYSSLDFWLIDTFCDHVKSRLLQIENLFDLSSSFAEWKFPNEHAIRQLVRDHPRIAAEFDVELPAEQADEAHA